MFGHKRKGSDSAAFKELTKRDAQIQLNQELDKLLRTCPENNREVYFTYFCQHFLFYNNIVIALGL